MIVFLSDRYFKNAVMYLRRFTLRLLYFMFYFFFFVSLIAYCCFSLAFFPIDSRLLSPFLTPVKYNPYYNFRHCLTIQVALHDLECTRFLEKSFSASIHVLKFPRGCSASLNYSLSAILNSVAATNFLDNTSLPIFL